jgi:hypothetical protein
MLDWYIAHLTLAAMSDLLNILRERLKTISAEMSELARRREQLARLKQTIEAAIIQEQALQAGAARSATPPTEPPDEDVIHAAGAGNLSNLLMDALSSGPKTLEELKVLAISWFPDALEKSPGRAINFALVGLQKGGHVDRLDNGAWTISGNSRK